MVLDTQAFIVYTMSVVKNTQANTITPQGTGGYEMTEKMKLAAKIAQTAVNKCEWTNETGVEFLKWADTHNLNTIEMMARNFTFMEEER